MERGTKLRELRRLKDLTQNYIADIIGISQKQVSSIENGKAHPRIDVHEQWCEVLEITIRQLEKMCEKGK